MTRSSGGTGIWHAQVVTPVPQSASLLQHLIRNACINDGHTGDETANADVIAGIIDVPGVDLAILDAAPGRRSVIARWPGRDPQAPATMLLSHTDVVPVVESQWQHDPFGGELIGTEIWGRGAVDMLCHTATMTNSFAELVRTGRHLNGDLVLAAVADEEALGVHGSQWLLAEHPEIMRADWVLTEGGGITVGNDQVCVLIADKGAWRVELSITGEPGHSSMSWGSRSALLIAAEVITRIADANIAAVVTQPWNIVLGHSMQGTDANTMPAAAHWDSILASLPRDTARVVHAATHMTIAPTSVSLDGSWNTTATQVRVGLDVRTLVGQTWSDVEDALQTAIGSLNERVSIRCLAGGTASFSPIDTPLWELVDRATSALLPSSAITPVMGGLTTDSRFFRERGAVAYGVGLMNPNLRPDQISHMMHGNDERIDLTSLDLLERFWAAIIHELD